MKLYDATFAVIDALERRQIEYVLVGGQAAIYYGIARSTLDADLVVELGTNRLEEIARELGPAFHLDPQRRFEIFTGKECFEIDVVGTFFKIEIFLQSNDPFDREAFQRRRRVQLHGHGVALATPEDVIVNKLRWRRPKDLVDAADLLSVQADALDWAYIERWCDAHGTRNLLDDLRRKIPPL